MKPLFSKVVSRTSATQLHCNIATLQMMLFSLEVIRMSRVVGAPEAQYVRSARSWSCGRLARLLYPGCAQVDHRPVDHVPMQRACARSCGKSGPRSSAAHKIVRSRSEEQMEFVMFEPTVVCLWNGCVKQAGGCALPCLKLVI